MKIQRILKKKIDESKEFRIKVQKLVYLSKFFGWDNSYHFVNYTPQNSTFDDLNTYEKIVKDKSKGLMSIFERYDVCSNRLFLLGSLDYFTFVLKHENVDAETRSELLKKLYDYAEEVEKEYFLIHPSNEELINIDLSNLEHHFDLLQDYISKELRIIPKLDENTDLSIFFEG